MEKIICLLVCLCVSAAGNSDRSGRDMPNAGPVAGTVSSGPRRLSAVVPDRAARRSEGALHRVLTCNVRVSVLPEDAEKGYGWDVRKKVCLDVIRACRPDVVCMQEVVPQSYRDLAEGLKEFASFGFAGPAMDRWPDGYHGIAKNVVFYKKARYEAVAAGTYWLSEKPLIAGSESWNTARPRQCNWVRLRDKRTGREFRVIDLHLDHRSADARARQIETVLEECAQYDPDFPQVMAGDFNSGLPDAPARLVAASGWLESYVAVHGSDSGYTYHGFQGDSYPRKDRPRIDFLFVRGRAEPVGAEIVKETRRGLYPSDHYFVCADIRIP